MSGTHGYVADKEALVRRLHRIEGQVRGIEKMVRRIGTASTSSRRSPR